MAKTIFGTSDKSNFILNMDLGRYRDTAAKLMMAILWCVGLSEGINHLTNRANAGFADMIDGGGFGAVIALLFVALRSTATIFSIVGVLAIIAMVIGLMRKQFSKKTAVPYLLLAGSLIWAVISLFHSYDLKTSFFGQDGRDEGWLALLIYAAVFYLGTMLREKRQQEKFLRGVMIFGIVQCIWGILQALPLIDYKATDFGLSPYRNLDPMLLWNLRLPTGMTDNPVTYAMMLGMLGAVSVPASLIAKEKKTIASAIICRCLCIVMAIKTQTVTGLIAAGGILICMIVTAVIKRKESDYRAWLMPLLTVIAVAVGGLWVWFTPAINQTYRRPDRATIKQAEEGIAFAAREDDVADIVRPNGFTMTNADGRELPALYDGGIVWDDGYYRLGTQGPYSATADNAVDVYDAFAVRKYCREQGVRALKIDPLLGVGPDNFYFTQLRVSYDVGGNPNSVDRPYDDYLYIAATRGIPSLILHIVLLGWCFLRAWQRRKDGNGWLLTAAVSAVLVYAVTAFTGISVLSVAPLFWMLLGMLAADPVAETAPAPAAAGKQNEKKDKKSGKDQA